MENDFKTLKKIDILSLCKFVLIVDFFLVLIFTVPFIFFMLQAPHLSEAETLSPYMWGLFCIGHPLLMACFAWVLGFIYNIFSKKIGGIKVILE